MCTECSHRFQAVEARLTDQKAILCTCRGQQHSYANEKCKLFTKKAGDKLWPGRNLEVTLEDFQFYERMRARKRQNKYDEAV